MVTHTQALLAIDARDENGEGPAWDAAQQRLLWSDNATGVIHEATSEGPGVWRESKHWNLSRPIGAAIPRRTGGLIVVGGTEVFTVDDAGKSTPFTRLDADPNLVTLNDAKCDPQGRLWAGTYATDLKSPRGALYRIDPDRTVTTMLDNVTISNGLDWSPDGATFYYIDSLTRSVDGFDFDPLHGTIGNRRTVLSVDVGGPDGMAVDREGDLWVAIYGLGQVRCYAPDGALRACVDVSTPAVTSCAFGGLDGKDLLITSVAHMPEAVLPIIGLGMDVVRQVAAAPGSGGLFVCRPGASGKPATPFAG